MEKLVGGIYNIQDIETGNTYIGSADSYNGIKKRWSNHLAKLRKGIHEYSQLQEAWDIDNNRIKWEILEECEDEELEEREQYWINYFGRIEGFLVINKQKNITRKSKVKDKSKMYKAQQGQNNGHCTVLNNIEAGEILWFKKNTDVAQKEIARLYNINLPLVSRVGNDRWPNVNPMEPEWLEKVI